MHRLRVYLIRLPKNYICKPPRYTTLVWRETEGDGDGDGDGDITRLVPKDADTSDSICQRIFFLIFYDSWNNYRYISRQPNDLIE